MNKYDLIYNHYNYENKVEDISSLFENKTYGTFTRMLSLSLRHGAAVQHIVEQLSKDDSEDLYSLSSVLRRALKRYIVNGVVVSGSKMKCPECSGTSLVYQEGCTMLRDCSWTAC